MAHPILLAAGSNAKGQLGIGSDDDAHTFTPCQFADYEPGRLPDHTQVRHVACGANHTVVLLEHADRSTALWGVGDASRGQLGPLTGELGVPARRTTVFRDLGLPVSGVYTLVTAAWETTYVVLERPERPDVLLSMGSNDFGALGVGEGRPGARTVSGAAGEPQVVEMDHLFPGEDGGRCAQRVQVRSIHAGPRHAVAELVRTSTADASTRTVLVGWGASRHGQLGQHGGARCVAQPTVLPIDVDDDPMVSCALGNQHTVVLHASGRVSALGSNKQGQIPSVDSQMHTQICGLGCTWNGTYMRISNGVRDALLSTGNGAQGQLGRGHGQHGPSTAAVDEIVGLPVDRTISSFVCGSEHVLVAMSGSSEAASVIGWGWNEHGNMGLGSPGNVLVPTQLWPQEDVEEYTKYPKKVIGIWAGCATSWLLVE